MGRGIGWMGALAALPATPALAQSVPPAALAPPTREQVERATPPEETAPPSRLTVRGGVAAAPCPLAASDLAGVTIPLEGVVFDDLRGLSPDALAPSFAGLVGTAVPLARVCGIRDAAAAILTRAGFIAAVEVPRQRVADGIVHLHVVMARLVAVHVRGVSGRAARRLEAYLARLTRASPFNTHAAERYLLLARDLPGFDVQLLLRPAGTVPGDVVGEVTATRLPIVVTANLQNEGSHAIGRWGGLVTAQANNLLGLGDRLTLGLYNTAQVHEQTVAQAGYDVRLGHEGLTLGGRVTYAWTRPDLGGGAHPLDSRTLVASVEAADPGRRSRRLDLRATGGIDLVNQQLDYLGEPLTRDRLRVLYARLDAGATGAAPASAADPRWRVGGALEVRHGLGILGATGGCGGEPDFAGCAILPTPSRLQGDPAATLVRFTGEAAWSPAPRVTLALAPRLQYAWSPLLSYEQYSGGAYTVGRGYDPGVIVGDSGAGTGVELRYGAAAPRDGRALALQPFAFTDAAWIWNRDAGFGIDRDRLLSAGAGVRAGWGDHARIDLTVAVPLHRTVTQTALGGPRLLVSFTTRLVPWRAAGVR